MALLYGAVFLLVGQEPQANSVPLDTAADWLHLLLGATTVGLSSLARDTPDRTVGRART